MSGYLSSGCSAMTTTDAGETIAHVAEPPTGMEVVEDLVGVLAGVVGSYGVIIRSAAEPSGK